MDGSRCALGQDAYAFLGCLNGGGRSKSTYRRESIPPPPAAWNALQSRHCASQRRQSTSAFSLDEGFQSFTNQRRLLRYSSELLGYAYEIVIQRNGCSHRNLQAPIIASTDVILCASEFLGLLSRHLTGTASAVPPALQRVPALAAEGTYTTKSGAGRTARQYAQRKIRFHSKAITRTTMPITIPTARALLAFSVIAFRLSLRTPQGTVEAVLRPARTAEDGCPHASLYAPRFVLSSTSNCSMRSSFFERR
jgi:hypothetical protein